MGRECQADLQLPGGGKSPAARFPEPGHSRYMRRTPKSVIARPRRGRGNPFPCKPLILRAPPGAQYWPRSMTGLTAGAMLRIA